MFAAGGMSALPAGPCPKRRRRLCIEDVNTFGQVTNCAAPRFTLRELVEYVGDRVGQSARVLSAQRFGPTRQAGLLWLLPDPPMSPDNLRSMDVDNVASAGGQTYPAGTRQRWKPSP